MDTKSKGKESRSEDLRYDSVVAINPGLYEVELMGNDGKALSKSQFVALGRESYVLIRSGVEAQQGPAYPQELIVYPKSDIHALMGSAMSAAKTSLAILALVFAVHWK